MGKSKNSYTVFGTRGNPQCKLSQGNAEKKARELAQKIEEEKKKKQDELVKPLVEAGVKFTREDVLFVTKDKSGQLIWLEKGNDRAGLKHLLYGNEKARGHKEDFEKAFGLTKDEIPYFLKDFITNGKLISSELKTIGTRQGYERVYENNNEYLVLVGVGTNGFIVTAYPRRK